ncbi:sigma-70 family RNA polymerase sigma factor [Evansella tamaricis]|nr:sigma-70 family RNA polymerase sigma factor [Evansella tamaricis]
MIKEVKKAKKGSTPAFERLINAHQVIMYRVARTILSREEDCADAIQESIIKSFEKLRTLREPAYFKTWLIRIVMNECYQILRHKKKLVSIAEWIEPGTVETGFDKIELDELLHILPDEQQHLLKMFYIEDISIHDLAIIYDSPENTIKTRLRRAREKLKEVMTQEGISQWKNGNGN